MDEQRIRPSVAVGVGVFLAALAAVVIVLESARRPAPSKASGLDAATTAAGDEGAREEKHAPAGVAHRDSRSRSGGGQERGDLLGTLGLDGAVLQEARERMPDNLYWELEAGGGDEAALSRRDEEQRRVLSGTATEEEIRAWYEHRRRLAGDFVEIAEFLKNRLRGRMPGDMAGALDLALALNADNLARIPAELERSLELARSRARAPGDSDAEAEEPGQAHPGQEGESPDAD